MAIVFILTLGLILRLININQSLWLDETVQAITSKGSFLGIFTELRGDFHPPLYHLIMWGWAHLFGNGEIAMRLPSVFFGTATIWVVYLIAKNLFPKKLSIIHSPLSIPGIVSLFLVTAPFHIYYSQEARTYAMTAFFACLSMYYFIRLVRSQELGVRSGEKKTQYSTLRTQNLKYILATVLLLYSDYYGLFVFLAQIIAAAIIFRKKFLSKYLNVYISIILLFLPCLPLLWIQLKTGSQATAFLPEWGRLVNLSFLKALPLTFIKFSIGRITIFDKKIYALVAGVLFLVYGGIILKAARGLMLDVRNVKTKDTKRAGEASGQTSRIILFCWLFVPILLAWGISFFVPNYQPFRLLLVLPAFYLLLAYGISKISVSMIRIIGTIFILLVNLVSVGVYYTNPYFHREDWRGAVKYIESQDGKSSLALIPSETSHWPYEYYSKGKVKLVGVGQEIKPVDEKDLEKLANSESLSIIHSPFSIYYLYYLADLFDPQSLIPNWLESQKFAKIGEVSFNQVLVQEWEKGKNE